MENLNSDNPENLTRRRVIQQLGMGSVALTAASCSSASVMKVVSELSTTSGNEVNWQHLISKMNSGITQIASQTIEVLKVQGSYTNVYELKDEEAEIQAELERIQSGNINEVDFSVTSKVSESAKDAVLVKVGEKQDLSNSQKQVLANGLGRHHRAVSNAWGGGARIVSVLIETTNARRPEVADFTGCITQITTDLAKKAAAQMQNSGEEESEKDPQEEEEINVLTGSCRDLGNAVSILINVPIALNFLRASKDSYEAHAEAFEYEAEVPVAASLRKLDLEPFDIEEA